MLRLQSEQPLRHCKLTVVDLYRRAHDRDACARTIIDQDAILVHYERQDAARYRRSDDEPEAAVRLVVPGQRNAFGLEDLLLRVLSRGLSGSPEAAGPYREIRIA